jgi:hypothetical protein
MRATLVVLVSAAVAGVAAVEAAHLFQAVGKATGTLTVGTSVTPLTHAYAFPAPSGEGTIGYRILVTDKPLSTAAIAHAVAAGTDAGARQELAVELAGRQIRGLEAVLAADRTVTRLNIYSADAAMGMMLLTPGDFEATTFGAEQLAGRFWTSAPIEDARLGKAVQYDATFAAPVHEGR